MADGERGDPAQAFEDLRAEVSVLRKAIEAMPAAVREHRAPDYSADLGILGKGLDEIGDQLGKIMKAPALVRTPEEQGHAIASAGVGLVREAAQRLDGAAQRLDGATRETDRERARLSDIVGQAMTKRRQFQVLCWSGAVALAIGLLSSPFIASALPLAFKTRVAAAAMGAERWKAGSDLMRAASPSDWSAVVADTQFVVDNRQAVEACRAAATKAGKAQHCTVMVAPPSTSSSAQPQGR